MSRWPEGVVIGGGVKNCPGESYTGEVSFYDISTFKVYFRNFKVSIERVSMFQNNLMSKWFSLWGPISRHISVEEFV